MIVTLFATFTRLNRRTDFDQIWQGDILYSVEEHRLHFIRKFSPLMLAGTGILVFWDNLSLIIVTTLTDTDEKCL